MDEKKTETTSDESLSVTPGENEGADRETNKGYKKPTIRRHGNLRLMTQLE